MPTTEQYEAASRKTSSPASIVSISVLIASLALVFRDGSFWFLALWVGSIIALTVVMIWRWAVWGRKRRLLMSQATGSFQTRRDIRVRTSAAEDKLPEKLRREEE